MEQHTVSEAIHGVTPEYLADEIRLWVTEGGLSWMEASVHCAELFGIDVEVLAEMLSADIKGLIEIEASDLNFIPKQARLPI